MTVPTILGSIRPPSGFPSPPRGEGRELAMTNVSGARVASRVVDVLEGMAPGGLAARRSRARLADSDHQHLGVHRLEPMAVLEVPLQLAHQCLFDVQDAAAKLADSVMMIAARELVVSRAVAEVRRVHRSRSGERFQ